MTFDFDWIVVGSGFGGSVAALRLSEKGYRVAVLETGRRYEDGDHATSAWNLRKFLWAPSLGLRGILRLSAFRDILIASGSAVGGGSAVYANTLYRPKPEFFTNPQWASLDQWQAALAPHYATAERMLGACEVPFETDAQRLLAKAGTQFGGSGVVAKPPVGVFFGAPGERVPDPYFGGDGPGRTGCTRCGACMVGCRIGAKNTLLKNYLWFAERHGARVFADTEVSDIRPRAAPDGSDGYIVTTRRPGAWFRKRPATFTTAGVVVAAGALGTNQLLASCRMLGALPRLSDRLGHLVRTNSEAIHAVRFGDAALRPWHDVAISASIHPSPDTHVELVTFGEHGDVISLILAPLTRGGNGVAVFGRLLAAIVRHPVRMIRDALPFGWSRHAAIVLVMQTRDNALTFEARRSWRGGVTLTTRPHEARPNPTEIPVARAITEWLATATGGTAHASLLEVLGSVPTTAHLLGGAVIGESPATGVIDAQHRAFGYRNLLVCDGSAVPANPGVNPALTITAMAERAMSFVPHSGRGDAGS